MEPLKVWEMASVIPEGGRNDDSIGTFIKGSYLKMCDDIQKAWSKGEPPDLFNITVDKSRWVIGIKATKSILDIGKEKGDT